MTLSNLLCRIDDGLYFYEQDLHCKGGKSSSPDAKSFEKVTVASSAPAGGVDDFIPTGMPPPAPRKKTNSASKQSTSDPEVRLYPTKPKKRGRRRGKSGKGNVQSGTVGWVMTKSEKDQSKPAQSPRNQQRRPRSATASGTPAPTQQKNKGHAGSQSVRVPRRDRGQGVGEVSQDLGMSKEYSNFCSADAFDRSAGALDDVAKICSKRFSTSIASAAAGGRFRATSGM